MNYYADSPTWKYLFHHAIDWKTILPLYNKEYPTHFDAKNEAEVLAFYESIVEQFGKWAANNLAPRAEELDHKGAGEIVDFTTVPSPALSKTFSEMKDMRIYELSAPEEFGGMELPSLLALMGTTFTGRACLSTSTIFGFPISVMDMIDRFGNDRQRKTFIPQLISGDTLGFMGMTEPGAGSDLGNIKTMAIKSEGNDKNQENKLGEEDLYHLNGSKIFISNASGIGLVLARIQGAKEGIMGISLFAVPEWIERDQKKVKNFKVMKNENKLGLKGSFTCELLFEHSEGHLIGKPGEGLKQMFHMMNLYRLGTGHIVIGAMEAVLDMIKNYAQERSQFGTHLMDLPLYKRNFDDMQTEFEALQVFLMTASSDYEIQQFLHKKSIRKPLNEAEAKTYKTAQAAIRKKTPLIKYYATETQATFAKKGIQAMGGYGFMKDFPAERYLRDSIGPVLYEGTSQIQSLMALKDLIKSFQQNPLSYIVDNLKVNPLALDKNEARFFNINREFQQNLAILTAKNIMPHSFKEILKFKNAKSVNFDSLMIHAETICQALSYVETLRSVFQLKLPVATDPTAESFTTLFERYYKLIKPRLKAIYTDWKIAR